MFLKVFFGGGFIWVYRVCQVYSAYRAYRVSRVYRLTVTCSSCPTFHISYSEPLQCTLEILKPYTLKNSKASKPVKTAEPSRNLYAA